MSHAVRVPFLSLETFRGCKALRGRHYTSRLFAEASVFVMRTNFLRNRFANLLDVHSTGQLALWGNLAPSHVFNYTINLIVVNPTWVKFSPFFATCIEDQRKRFSFRFAYHRQRLAYLQR